MTESLALLVLKLQRIKCRTVFMQFMVLFVILSSVGLSISACSHQKPTISDSIAQTTVPTSTLGSTEFDAAEEITPAEINQEAIAVITDTVIVENSIDGEKCIEGIIELGEDKNIFGTLVLYIDDNGFRSNLLFFDPETQEITEITPPDIDEHSPILNGLSVSPDGEYLAYQTSYFIGEAESAEYIGNKINIITAENEMITEVDNIYPTMYFEWLNNNSLLIELVQEKYPLLLTDISSGYQKSLYSTLGKGIVDTDIISAWYFYEIHKNVYNSDLSCVVYPSKENGEPVAIVRDLENNSDILTIPTKVGFGSSPVWSQDGNYLAIAIADDRPSSEYYIYIVNRYGDIIFQTEKSSIDMQKRISRLSWSPDSELLAFVYVLEEASGDTRHLGILDIEDEKITLYCSPEVYPYTQLYWSPDNQYLLYPSQSANSDKLSSYVLNIETGQNYLVMDGYFPGGWM